MIVPPALMDANANAAVSADQPTSDRDHTHMLTVFSVSAGMVGVCLTAIGLIQVMEMLKSINTLCDEILVADALLFLSSCLFSYWALHHRFRRHYRRLRLAVDSLLMAGIILMAGVCGMIAYTITESPAPVVQSNVENSAGPVSGRQP